MLALVSHTSTFHLAHKWWYCSALHNICRAPPTYSILHFAITSYEVRSALTIGEVHWSNNCRMLLSPSFCGVWKCRLKTALMSLHFLTHLISSLASMDSQLTVFTIFTMELSSAGSAVSSRKKYFQPGSCRPSPDWPAMVDSLAAWCEAAHKHQFRWAEMGWKYGGCGFWNNKWLWR